MTVAKKLYVFIICDYNTIKHIQKTFIYAIPIFYRVIYDLSYTMFYDFVFAGIAFAGTVNLLTEFSRVISTEYLLHFRAISIFLLVLLLSED